MFKKFRSHLILATLIALTIPTFWRLLRPGIFSMHDFHVFRMFEFHKCISDFSLPCRWAQDSGFGYGEPLFNFYGQLPYILGEPFVLTGLSIITTVKILFILSLIGSAVAMFFLARYLFKSDVAAFIAGVLYIYAPYRAVDVWVRGALPESLAFVFFPLILLFFNKYLQDEKRENILFFALISALLIITHNLSFLMFLPFLGLWSIYFLTINKRWSLFPKLVLAGFLTLGLTAFYLLPVVIEGKLVNLAKTTEDYYNFRAHFTTLNQLFVARSWGYGASQFGPDDNLSFSAGHLQWILSVVILAVIFATRKIKEYFHLILIVGFAWFALFLTHGKSVPLWEVLTPLKYIQFPWRFLSISTLFFTVAAAGFIVFLKHRYLKILVAIMICVLAILLNFSYFREDRWFTISDREQFSGERWQEQIASAVNDFWPKYGEKIPNSEAPDQPVVIEGEGQVGQFEKRSHSATTQVSVFSKQAELQFPIVYFPGWQLLEKNQPLAVYPSGSYGQITVQLDQGENNLKLQFTNTMPRTIGNLISLSSLIFLIVVAVKPQLKLLKHEK